MAALSKKYTDEVVPALKKSQNYVNVMNIPKLGKVVVNIAVNTSVDRDTFKAVVDDIATITGQRPMITKAKKSVANFKLREGMPIGAKVTLRGKRMYEFLDRLIQVALPRIRDFRGVPVHSFDKQGNYAMGLTEQAVFPEIDPDHIKRTQGMDIVIVTTAKNAEESKELLMLLGMPFATG